MEYEVERVMDRDPITVAMWVGYGNESRKWHLQSEKHLKLWYELIKEGGTSPGWKGVEGGPDPTKGTNRGLKTALHRLACRGIINPITVLTL